MCPLASTTIRARVRADALPEYTRYQDDGCHVHPHCLTCPLPRCRYDAPGGLRALLNAHRDRQIVEIRRMGATVDARALRFGVSRRTIFRILENQAPRCRRNGHEPRPGVASIAVTAIPLTPRRREEQHA